MTALLDTHIFLWWLYESSRLSVRVRGILEDESNTLLFSSASV
jgi:PIN domain nuclease of toxin-antitoxin system